MISTELGNFKLPNQKQNLFKYVMSKSAFHLYIKILIIILIICLYEAPGWLDAGLIIGRFSAVHGIILKVLAVATFSLLSVIGIYISKRNVLYLDDLIFIGILVFLNMYKWRQAKHVTEAFETLATESSGDMYYTEPGREDPQVFNMYPLDKLPEDRDELVHKINRPEHYDYTPDDIPGYLTQPAITRLEGLRDKIQRDKNYRYNNTVRPFDTKDIPGSPEPIKANTRTPIDDLFRKGGNPAYKLADEVLTVLESCPNNQRSAAVDSHQVIEPALSHRRSNGVGSSKYRFLTEPEPNLKGGAKGIPRCTDDTNEKRARSLQRLIGSPAVDDDQATIREYSDFITEINNADKAASGRPLALAGPKPVSEPTQISELKPYRDLGGVSYTPYVAFSGPLSKKPIDPLPNNSTFKDIQLRDLEYEAAARDNVFTPRDPRLRLADGYSFAQADGINAKLGGNSIKLFDSCTNYSIPSPDSLKRINDNCARRLDGSCLSD
jgi:hypothetical protein